MGGEAKNTCINMYGENGIVTSVNEFGTPVCGCANGFTVGVDGTCSKLQGIKELTREDTVASDEGGIDIPLVVYIASIGVIGVLLNLLRMSMSRV
jgi:hypothetical protein